MKYLTECWAVCLVIKPLNPYQIQFGAIFFQENHLGQQEGLANKAKDPLMEPGEERSNYRSGGRVFTT